MPGVKSGAEGCGSSGTVRAPGGAGGNGTRWPGTVGASWPGIAEAGTPGDGCGPWALGADVATLGPCPA